MPRRKNLAPSLPQADTSIAAIKYPAKRKNIPPAGLEAQGRIQEAPKLRYEYNPHLPPVLRFSDSPAIHRRDRAQPKLRRGTTPDSWPTPTRL